MATMTFSFLHPRPPHPHGRDRRGRACRLPADRAVGSSGTQTLQVVDSQTGTITGVTEVPVPASTMNQAGGALAGAVVGGLLGNQVGQGTGNTVATTVGALGGAAAGAAAARSVNGGTIPQWTVALDNGRTVAVQSNTAGLRVGSRVRVQQLSNGELRIGAI